VQQVKDFLDESEDLARLLEPLPDDGFRGRTQFRRWIVDDVIGHLHLFNVAADLALRDEEAFTGLWRRIVMALQRGSSLCAFAEEWLEGTRGRALFELWRSFCPQLAGAYAEADPRRRVRWAGPDMSTRSCITARQMETWAHGQSIYDLLGMDRVDADRIRNIAVLGVNTFAWSFANRGLEAPGEIPEIRLTAPSGATWEWLNPASPDSICGSATAFCQVVTQTRNVADTDLAVRGETARRWMAIAQCFAGPAVDPPAPGTRFAAHGAA
jgi:uncharacterized protein (TIGR03084 family)